MNPQLRAVNEEARFDLSLSLSKLAFKAMLRLRRWCWLLSLKLLLVLLKLVQKLLALLVLLQLTSFMLRLHGLLAEECMLIVSFIFSMLKFIILSDRQRRSFKSLSRKKQLEAVCLKQSTVKNINFVSASVPQP